MWYFVLTKGIWVQTTIVMFLVLLVTVNISCWLLCSRVEGHTSAELLGAFPTKSATVSFLRFARHNLLLAAGAIQWLWAKQLQFWKTFARGKASMGITSIAVCRSPGPSIHCHVIRFLSAFLFSSIDHLTCMVIVHLNCDCWSHKVPTETRTWCIFLWWC